MDQQNQEAESRRSGSFGPSSVASSSRRRSLSFAMSTRFDDIVESENVSEAGDIGDRALHSNRYSVSGRSPFSLDDGVGNGVVVPVEERHSSFSSDLKNILPVSNDATTQSAEKEKDAKVHLLLDYISCLLALAVFGILGVLMRYCLQKLFGPGVIGATSESSYMYLDLPSNMIGSFLMGWFGVVFKGDISKVSDQLAIGLSTGFLGSLTTFSGWNQKMLDLSVQGHWVFAALGFFIGLFLAAYAIIFGIETAKGFRWLCRRSNIKSYFGIPNCLRACNSNKSQCVLTFTVMLLLVFGSLWGLFGALLENNFENGGSQAQLFFACIVGPFGVWIRWFLARLNGRGIGKTGMVKWMPFGTLAANVLAASLMAALATLKQAETSKTCETVASGLQFGLLGCLSTVSTFIAEFHAMRESMHPWRAYAYAATTFVTSFLMGTLIYSVPVWVRGYN